MTVTLAFDYIVAPVLERFGYAMARMTAWIRFAISLCLVMTLITMILTTHLLVSHSISLIGWITIWMVAIGILGYIHLRTPRRKVKIDDPEDQDQDLEAQNQELDITDFVSLREPLPIHWYSKHQARLSITTEVIMTIAGQSVPLIEGTGIDSKA